MKTIKTDHRLKLSASCTPISPHGHPCNLQIATAASSETFTWHGDGTLVMAKKASEKILIIQAKINPQKPCCLTQVVDMNRRIQMKPLCMRLIWLSTLHTGKWHLCLSYLWFFSVCLSCPERVDAGLLSILHCTTHRRNNINRRIPKTTAASRVKHFRERFLRHLFIKTLFLVEAWGYSEVTGGMCKS